MMSWKAENTRKSEMTTSMNHRNVYRETVLFLEAIDSNLYWELINKSDQEKNLCSLIFYVDVCTDLWILYLVHL